MVLSLDCIQCKQPELPGIGIVDGATTDGRLRQTIRCEAEGERPSATSATLRVEAAPANAAAGWRPPKLWTAQSLEAQALDAAAAPVPAKVPPASGSTWMTSTT